MKPKRERKYAQFVHPKSPQRFTQPQIMVCVLLTQYLNLSYRNTEEWLLASAEVLELTEVPDHSTISRILKWLTMPRLEAMLAEILTQIEGKENVVAVDATRFRFTQASACYTARSERVTICFLKKKVNDKRLPCINLRMNPKPV